MEVSSNTPAVVTGGASGLGEATARALAAKGAKVAKGATNTKGTNSAKNAKNAKAAKDTDGAKDAEDANDAPEPAGLDPDAVRALIYGLDEIERVSTRWPAYEALLTERITPLLCDLVDAVGPLLRSGLRAVPASASAHHFELFACDLVVRASGEPVLMEVNINPAFGTFTDATVAELCAESCTFFAVQGELELGEGNHM